MTSDSSRPSWSLARRISAASVAAVVWTHALSAVARHFGSPDAPLASGALTWLALAVTALGAIR